MTISLQSSRGNACNSDTVGGHLTVPLRSLAMGKEVTMDFPATNVSGLNWMGRANGNEDRGFQDPMAPQGLQQSSCFDFRPRN
jgi:hypothetical protein